MQNISFNKPKQIVLVLIIMAMLILFDTLTPVTAHAQSFSLSIFPSLLEVTIMPGKAITQSYQLTNDGENTTINTAILPFGPNDEFGNVLLGNETSEKKYNWQEWFNFENADIKLGEPFFLAAKESKQIVLKVNIPEEVKEDDYYFTLLFSTQPGQANLITGTRQAGVIGSNLLITVSKTGEPIKTGEITEFKLSNPLVSIFKLKILDSFE